MLRSGVASWKRGLPEMGNPVEPTRQTACKYFSAPNAAVVAVASAVEADSEDPLVPLAAFGKHGGNMRAVVLDGELFWRRQTQGMDRGTIFGMRIVNDERVLPADLVHVHQVANRLFRIASRADGTHDLGAARVVARLVLHGNWSQRLFSILVGFH